MIDISKLSATYHKSNEWPSFRDMPKDEQLVEIFKSKENLCKWWISNNKPLAHPFTDQNMTEIKVKNSTLYDILDNMCKQRIGEQNSFYQNKKSDIDLVRKITDYYLSKKFTGGFTVKKSDLCAYQLLTKPNALVSPVGLECVFYLATQIDPENTRDLVIKEQFDMLSPIKLLTDIMKNATDVKFESTDLIVYKKGTMYENTIKENPDLNKISNLIDEKNISGTVNKLNKIIEQKTNNLIKDFIQEKDFSGLLLCIINIIYFLGKWEQSFDKKNNTKHKWDDHKTIDFMTQTNRSYSYLETEFYRSVEIPYSNKDFVYGIVLNKPIHPLKHYTDESKILMMYAEKPITKIDVLTMPKFEVRYVIDSSEIKKVFGFTGDASCKQEAVIKVNEEGTEAAAVTSYIKNRSAQATQLKFIADKPFEYYIKYIPSNTILFMGRMNDPEA
jgi:hypothetical protein